MNQFRVEKSSRINAFCVTNDTYSTVLKKENEANMVCNMVNTMLEKLNELAEENKDLREQLILANAFIKMIENCYEDASIEDILYMKYGEFQEELHLQIAIAKEEL